MKKTLLPFMLSLLFCCAATAQTTQTIKGEIIDKDTQQPLIGATILVSDLEDQLGTTTDIDGRFELTGVPTGRHRLEFSYVGFTPFVMEDAIVNSAKELVVKIELIEAVLTTEEVVITARAYGNEALNPLSMVSTRSFSAEETQRYPASANDPSRMAVSFPGVQASRDNRSDIVIRGNAGFGML